MKRFRMTRKLAWELVFLAAVLVLYVVWLRALGVEIWHLIVLLFGIYLIRRKARDPKVNIKNTSREHPGPQ